MAWLTWFALESTLALAAALFTANFTLLVMWRRTERGRPLLAGLAVSILLLAIQGLLRAGNTQVVFANDRARSVDGANHRPVGGAGGRFSDGPDGQGAVS